MSRKASTSTPEALKHFDHLPNSARVRLPVVQGLFGLSAATVWRRCRTGALPPPKKSSANVTSWSVGELRAALKAIGGDE